MIRHVTSVLSVRLIWVLASILPVLATLFCHLFGRVWCFLAFSRLVVRCLIIVNRLSEILFCGTLLMFLRFLWEKIKLVSVVVFPCATVLINSLFRLILYTFSVWMSLLCKSVSHEIVLVCNWPMVTIINVVVACAIATLQYLWLFFLLSISFFL